MRIADDRKLPSLRQLQTRPVLVLLGDIGLPIPLVMPLMEIARFVFDPDILHSGPDGPLHEVGIVRAPEFVFLVIAVNGVGPFAGDDLTAPIAPGRAHSGDALHARQVIHRHRDIVRNVVNPAMDDHPGRGMAEDCFDEVRGKETVHVRHHDELALGRADSDIPGPADVPRLARLLVQILDLMVLARGRVLRLVICVAIGVGDDDLEFPACRLHLQALDTVGQSADIAVIRLGLPYG